MTVKLRVQYISETYDIPVLSDYLNIKFTYQYVMQLDNELSILQAKRVLYWTGKLYNNAKGINEASLLNLARGVKSNLL